MKIEVTNYVAHREIVDICLPFYYTHNLLADFGDSIIYGKIEEKLTTKIQISNNWRGGTTFEIEFIEGAPSSRIGCYLTEEHKSTEEEYTDAVSRLVEAAKRGYNYGL